jgi:hypothetical protein
MQTQTKKGQATVFPRIREVTPYSEGIMPMPRMVAPVVAEKVMTVKPPLKEAYLAARRH